MEWKSILSNDGCCRIRPTVARPTDRASAICWSVHPSSAFNSTCPRLVTRTLFMPPTRSSIKWFLSSGLRWTAYSLGRPTGASPFRQDLEALNVPHPPSHQTTIDTRSSVPDADGCLGRPRPPGPRPGHCHGGSPVRTAGTAVGRTMIPACARPHDGPPHLWYPGCGKRPLCIRPTPCTRR